VSSVTDVLTAPGSTRCRPWDAGPDATARDLAALWFVGEQGAMGLGVLAVALGRLSPVTLRNADRVGERTVRQRVECFEQAGWVERQRAHFARLSLAALEARPAEHAAHGGSDAG
jgi:hypothetical protein